MGNYRVVITALDEATQQKAYTSLSFHITSETEVTDLWTAYEAIEGGARGKAIDDYKRALSAAATAQNESAVSWLQRALADDPTYVLALSKLVDILSKGSRYKEIAELSA